MNDPIATLKCDHRQAAIALVVSVIGALTFVLMRRARGSRDKLTPAPVTVPVHMAVGASAPQTPIADEAGTAG